MQFERKDPPLNVFCALFLTGDHLPDNVYNLPSPPVECLNKQERYILGKRRKALLTANKIAGLKAERGCPIAHWVAVWPGFAAGSEPGGQLKQRFDEAASKKNKQSCRMERQVLA
ncbi:hypothetical protein J437_LFUL009788 [Ladona fulva]|uniref:Uncharacterized protein n=1 Tax=Ladona fulva TaxID=123851 RepID=A0A8K0KAM0_LADFU|nr:hypothetical protein J437_LFUL009788 [Ladona fulva]